MERLIKHLNKKYNSSVSIVIKFWCLRAGYVSKHYELLIAGHGTEYFETTEELIAYIKELK